MHILFLLNIDWIPLNVLLTDLTLNCLVVNDLPWGSNYLLICHFSKESFTCVSDNPLQYSQMAYSEGFPVLVGDVCFILGYNIPTVYIIYWILRIESSLHVHKLGYYTRWIVVVCIIYLKLPRAYKIKLIKIIIKSICTKIKGKKLCDFLSILLRDYHHISWWN